MSEQEKAKDAQKLTERMAKDIGIRVNLPTLAASLPYADAMVQMAEALEESHNALLDYVERLEKQPMTTMGYGRSVIAQDEAALSAYRALNPEASRGGGK